jgi:hypothetical protein
MNAGDNFGFLNESSTAFPQLLNPQVDIGERKGMARLTLSDPLKLGFGQHSRKSSVSSVLEKLSIGGVHKHSRNLSALSGVPPSLTRLKQHVRTTSDPLLTLLTQLDFPFPRNNPKNINQSELSKYNHKQQLSITRTGGDDLHSDSFDRSRLAKLISTVDKLDFLIQLEDHIPDNLRSLTENARNFVNCCLPIIHCFRRHHNSDKKLFEETYDQGFAYTTFRKVHCNVLRRGYVERGCPAAVKKQMESLSNNTLF